MEQFFLIAGTLQTAAGCIYFIGYYPLVKKLVQTQNVEGMSCLAWSMWFVSSLFALLYSVALLSETGTGWALVFSNGIACSLVGCTTFLVYLYSWSSQPPPRAR
ncbi:PQ-loop domain-containing transporter [bacterium]|nr:PQ-loop domain-containing transporter [bacterium]